MRLPASLRAPLGASSGHTVRALTIVTGVALVAGVAATPSASALSASLGAVGTPVIPRCEPNIVVVVPGGGNSVENLPENLPVGGYTADVGAHLDQEGRSTTRTVSYNSGAFVFRDYLQAAQEATSRTRNTVARVAAECPGSTISLFGYSLGADAAAHVAAEIGQGSGPVSADRFGSGVFQANPYRGAATTQGGTAAPGTGVLGDLSENYGAVTGRIMDVCDSGDFTCDSGARTGDVRANREAFLDVSVRTGYLGALTAIPGEQRGAVATDTVLGVLPGAYLHTTSYGPTGSFSRGEGFLRSHLA